MEKLKSTIKKYLKSHKIILIIVAVAIVSRLLLMTFGVLVSKDDKVSTFPNNYYQAWMHWDGLHYKKIVDVGYDNNFPTTSPEDPVCNQGTGYCQRNVAFFPLYPLSISIFKNIGFSAELAGFMIANVSFIGAVVFLFLLARKLFDEKVAILSTVALIVFPSGYVFSAFMTESLFLMLLTAAYYFAYSKKWIVAGIFAALLSATRIIGIAIGLSFVLLYIEQVKGIRNIFKNLNWRFLVALILVPLGLLAFMLFLKGHVGDPLAFINIQRYWEKSVLDGNPIVSIVYSLISTYQEGGIVGHLYNIFFFMINVVVFVWATFKRILPFSLTSIILWLFVPLTAGTMLALSRYSLISLPVYLFIGYFVNKYPRLGKVALLASGVSLIIMTLFYVNNFWITV